MRVLFDTSVLVAAQLLGHRHHRSAQPWLDRAQTGQLSLLVSTHSVAELFAVLTTLPQRPRLSPRSAWTLIEDNVVKHAELIALDGGDYAKVLERLAALGVPGGTVFDALHCEAARKGRADLLLTLNPKHFLRAWPEGAEKIREP